VGGSRGGGGDGGKSKVIARTKPHVRGAHGGINQTKHKRHCLFKHVNEGRKAKIVESSLTNKGKRLCALNIYGKRE
jgi:hypothetical protein